MEFSPDATFPAGRTVRYTDCRSPFSPDEPLAPGKWYWRVTLLESDTTSVVWNFDQTAALTADCTAPVIKPDHAYLAGPRQAVTVHYRDNVGVTKVDLTLDGRPVGRSG